MSFLNKTTGCGAAPEDEFDVVHPARTEGGQSQPLEARYSNAPTR
jgi:hypothetical protein